MTVITECISWLINVTYNNNARWKPEINEILLTNSYLLIIHEHFQSYSTYAASL